MTSYLKTGFMALALSLAAGLFMPVPVRAQQQTESQKKLKQTKKKRMKEARIAEREGKKFHMSIQSKDTQKRMKKHLKQTRKYIKGHQHRRD